MFPDFVNFLTLTLADLSNKNNRRIFYDLVADVQNFFGLK